MNIRLDDKQFEAFFTQAEYKDTDFDAYMNDLLGQLHKRIVGQPQFSVSIENKLDAARHILRIALEEYPVDDIALAWTGGKDSTLILWLMKEIVVKMKLPLPEIVFIDEGYVFEEVVQFCTSLAKKWKFDYVTISNTDVLKQAKKVGDKVRVDTLNKRNKEELKRLKYTKKSFSFDPESMVGNHLMKTVTQNVYLETTGEKALITGIRWDEQEARADETYFSQRGDEYTPMHTRVHPILHLSEKDIWEAIMEYDVPYCPLYKKGYRSLGAKGTTTKKSDIPAWEQDLENTTEREGRAQDKEEIMKRLRDLGYM